MSQPPLAPAELARRLRGLNLYLVGMMGAGKSAVGRPLADALGYRFLDADQVLEQQAAEASAEAEQTPVEIRTKSFPSVAMSVDDAVDNMELVGHPFYLFIDSETGRPSVVYRRHAYDYGMIALSDDAE